MAENSSGKSNSDCSSDSFRFHPRTSDAPPVPSPPGSSPAVFPPIPYIIYIIAIIPKNSLLHAYNC